MPIVFSSHAKQRLKRRHISQKLVKKVIISSEKRYSSFRGRKLRRLRVGSKLIEVITRTEGSKITVVTAYFVKE